MVCCTQDSFSLASLELLLPSCAAQGLPSCLEYSILCSAVHNKEAKLWVHAASQRLPRWQQLRGLWVGGGGVGREAGSAKPILCQVHRLGILTGAMYTSYLSGAGIILKHTAGDE